MSVEFPLKLAVSKTGRVEEMRSGEEVSAMVRLHEVGWGSKRIAQEFGCDFSWKEGSDAFSLRS